MFFEIKVFQVKSFSFLCKTEDNLYANLTPELLHFVDEKSVYFK